MQGCEVAQGEVVCTLGFCTEGRTEVALGQTLLLKPSST